MTEYLHRLQDSSEQVLVCSVSCYISQRLFVGSLGSSLHLFLSLFRPYHLRKVIACRWPFPFASPRHGQHTNRRPSATHPHKVERFAWSLASVGHPRHIRKVLFCSLCRYITIYRTTSARPQTIRTTLTQSIPTDIVGILPGLFYSYIYMLQEYYSSIHSITE